MPSCKSIALLLVTLSAAPFAGAQLTISTFAGNGTAGNTGVPGQATAAELNLPVEVASDGAGNLYIADQKNNQIRVVNKSGVIAVFAGNGTAGFSGDGGQAVLASLNAPTDVYVDPFGGAVYISDTGNQRIRVVVNGVISTVAGSGAQGYSGDGGPATSAALYNPVRVITDVFQNIVIADQSNHRIRSVSYITGIITTIAGNGTQGFSGDGGPATSAELNNPTSIATGPNSGDLLICDQFNHRIRKVDFAGTITTIAGTGTAGFSGDGGPATAAELNYPGGMTTDSEGNLFFSDDTNYRVREISSSGVITTVAGNGTQGFSGDGGPAISAELNGQFGVALDSLGNLYIADSVNNRVRMVSQADPITPVFATDALTNAASLAQGGSPGALATLFGSHLTLNLLSFIDATQSPLPITLNGTTVTVNGFAAPILTVDSSDQFGDQINFQIPWEVAGQSTISVVVNNGMASNVAVSVPITVAQPGVFEIFDSNLSQQVGAVEHVNGSVVSSLSPAAPGETVVVYCTGLGPVSPALVTGVAAPGSPLSRTTYTPVVTIGPAGSTVMATVEFSGAAPYFSGLNQMNVTLPANAPSGLQPMVVSVNGVSATPVNISIQ